MTSRWATQDPFMKTGEGRQTHPKKVVHVEDATCEKGGLHDLTNKQVKNFPVTYCQKCGRTSAELDGELNNR